jgi:flagellin
MALTVATNSGALMAQAAASSVNKSMENSMERLATGKRINSASDDAAGVAIASRLTSEIKGTNQAIRNAMDGQAMIDTAEGGHIEIENILQRMRELAVQSRNDSNDGDDRANLQLEVDALTSEIDRIANSTSWAGQKLLTGSGGNASNGTFNMQVGSRTSAENRITATISAVTAAGLGVGTGNASVGASGATLLEVGENILQASGTPVTGDTYQFDLNGVAVKVELTNDAAGSATANFDYKLTIGTGSATQTVSNAASIADGKTKAAVADILKQAIDTVNTTTGSKSPGLTATANADGSLTIIQSTPAVTGGADADMTSTATIATDTWVAPAADVTAVVLADGTTGQTFDDATTVETTLTSTTGTNVAIESVSLTIGGEVVIAETAISAILTAGYSGGAAGVADWLSDQVAANTNLKGLDIKVGSKANNVLVQITQTASTVIANEKATAGSATSAIDVTTTSGIDAGIVALDAAVKTLNTQRATLGAISNRLDSTVSNLTNISSNLSAGKGRIEDADFAAETTNLAKLQLLQQAATAMLAQANASKQNILTLLKM